MAGKVETSGTYNVESAEKPTKLNISAEEPIFKPRFMRRISLQALEEKSCLEKGLLHFHAQSPVEDVSKHGIADRSFQDDNIRGNLEAAIRLRNTVPALRSYREVYFDTANNNWIIQTRELSPGCCPVDLPLKIGGCPVYLHDFVDDELVQGFLADNFSVDPMRLCDGSEIWFIAKIFPHALGMRVHKWGHVDILYESWKQRRQDLGSLIPGSISGMSYAMKLRQLVPSNPGVRAGVEAVGQRFAEPEDALQASDTFTISYNGETSS